jgi:undecaprenyl diphosphate synthase
MQSYEPSKSSLHVAIIMDGNGRWATRRGLPRTLGHRAGAEAMRRAVRAAPDLGISTLTLFAFSSYNWGRAPAEVEGLMRLLGDYLGSETRMLVESGARLSLIGRRDRLPKDHREKLARIEAATLRGERLHIRIAVDYSAREAIEMAAERWRAVPSASQPAFGQMVAQSSFDGDDEAANVDLLIRTGGDRRLSDFLLWECAFAELCFTDQLWPDFDGVALKSLVEDFRTRERASAIIPAPRLSIDTPINGLPRGPRAPVRP